MPNPPFRRHIFNKGEGKEEQKNKKIRATDREYSYFFLLPFKKSVAFKLFGVPFSRNKKKTAA